MIKLTIEMKNEKFEWEYEFPGGINHHGIEDVTPETLECFTMMIKMCHNHTTHRYKEWMDEIRAKAYLEKHPELFKHNGA